MARNESDREDLLREATALVQRAEVEIAGIEDHVIIGFRRDGAGSIYVGNDTAYQFNSKGQLRRGFDHGRLIKAEKGKLVSLNRRRNEGQVQLVRHDLNEHETEKYMTQVHGLVSILRQAINQNRFTLIGKVPADADLVSLICGWLESLGPRIPIAGSPRVA